MSLVRFFQIVGLSVTLFIKLVFDDLRTVNNPMDWYHYLTIRLQKQLTYRYKQKDLITTMFLDRIVY